MKEINKKIFCIFLLFFSQFGLLGEEIISSIKIQILGAPTVSESFVKQNLQVQENAIYQPTLIDKSIQNLMETGSFKDVKVYRLNNKKTEVSLLFKVYPNPKISEILFEGNEKLSEKKLRKKITSKRGGLLDDFKVNTDKIVLQELYYDEGFWNSQVNVEKISSNDDNSTQILMFFIIENDSRKIGSIQFKNNFHLSNDELLTVMETAPWRFWRFWSARSKYRKKILLEDLEKVIALYKDEGFLDAKIDPSKVFPIPTGSNRINLQIDVSEGNRSYFGEIQIVGNVEFETNELQKKSLIKTGQPYSPSLLGKERARLKRIYGEIGFLDAQILVIRNPNLITNQIDVKFEIVENKKFKVDTIEVRGNEKTKSIVLLRELALSPGETFDLTRMEIDEDRLMNTKLFESVTVADEPILTKGSEIRESARNMVIDVTEGRTGHFGFGVGFSSLERAMMYAEIRQGNFDLFRWRSPNRFQGDGQKFRLRLKLGSKSNEARLAIEEPWFLNRRVAAGFELFREKSDYQSSYYDELRAGFEIYFRKRLFELVEGRLFYSFEDVLIEDIDTSSSRTNWITDPTNGDPNYDSTRNEIKRTISKVGLTLSRDTRDAILFPTKGSIASIRKEFAGGIFGGDADYGRLEIQGARFLKTFDAMEQVLTISGKTGTLGKFDGNDANVPFFDRFFLGGPYNLRGWDYRGAGPKDETDQEEPMGGNSITYASLEYTFKIADPLRFALFYDAGYLRKGDFKLTPGSGNEDWHDNWGLGIRIMVMGMPLRLDLGFPITDPGKGGNSSQFHFSGGTRF
jgi:outer membrane protein insertion porin family